MKKLIAVLVVLIFTTTIFAESPQIISYQAIIRNAKDVLVANQTVGMQISIYYYTTTTQTKNVYVEKQTPITNENGLITIAIGTGTVVLGVFGDIDWATKAFYMKIEIDPGGRSSYTITSDTQILSVPFALHAKTATTAESLTLNGATYSPDFLVDKDGNAYKTIKIGNQIWMAENLKVTRYRNGVVIPNVTDSTAWSVLTTGAWCDYANLSVNGSKYGHLYNWYTVTDSQNIAPEGWHVATDTEWTELENYLIANGGNWDGTTMQNKIGKSLAAATNWLNSPIEGTVGNDLLSNNITGFTALPAGFRYGKGKFDYVGNNCYWWRLTEASAGSAWYRSLYYDNSSLGKSNFTKISGFSVRCVKD